MLRHLREGWSAYLSQPIPTSSSLDAMGPVPLYHIGYSVQIRLSPARRPAAAAAVPMIAGDGYGPRYRPRFERGGFAHPNRPEREQICGGQSGRKQKGRHGAKRKKNGRQTEAPGRAVGVI